jgi:hypothetical protein
MGDHNQDPWRPGGSAWITIAAVACIMAAVSAVSNLIDPSPASAGPLEGAAFAEASSPFSLVSSPF